MIEKILDPLLAPFRYIRDKVFQVKQVPARLSGEVNRARGQVGQIKSDYQNYRSDVKGLQGKAGKLPQRQPGSDGVVVGPQAAAAPAQGQPQARKKMSFFASLFGVKPKCPGCGNKLHPSWTECPYCHWSPSLSGAQPAGGAAPAPAGGAVPPPLVAPMPSGDRPAGTIAIDTRAANLPSLGGASTSIIGWFIPLEGPQMGELFQVKGRTSVGKSPDNTIVINESSVSGHHAEFIPTATGFRLQDLGSTNGTFVNDKRVQQHDLIDNDNVRLGRLNFKYKSII